MDGEGGSELYILPEMWNTGFDTSDRIRQLLSTGNNALKWMQKTHGNATVPLPAA